ncbi:hypothetical protein ABVT39_023217 [Epinephelus coioides]
MLTLQCMAWNKMKQHNMCSMLCKRFNETHANLAKGRESLEALQSELSLDEMQTNQWIHDVQDWAQSGPDSGLRCTLSRKLNTLQMQLRGVREAHLQIFQTPGSCAEPLTALDDDGGMFKSSSDEDNV